MATPLHGGIGMLVLTRNEGESIMIGDDVEVMIVMSEGGQVRVGINAPRSVPIVRSEILDRDAENSATDAAKDT